MEEDPIACTFVSLDGSKTLGYIYKSDIDANGDCKIFCYEKKKKNGKSSLVYTSNEEEYKKYLQKNGVKLETE